MNEFLDIIDGQEKVKEILNSIQKERRVPHAFLFCGREGVGKFYTALQFAKSLSISSQSSVDDIVLKKLARLQEPYIKLVFPLPRGRGESSDDTATEKLSKDQLESLNNEIENKIKNPYHKIYLDNANNIKINSIRDVKKFLEFSYDEIKYRFVFIIDAHLMNDQAQNALLKSLEEPPERIIFFIITSDKEKLLTTIKSRCWNIDFDPLTNERVKKILINNFSIEENLAKNASYFSGGSVSEALPLASEDFKEILEGVISFLRYSIGKKYHSALKELTNLMQVYSNQDFNLILKLVRNWLNDLLKVKYSNSDFFFEDYKDTFIKFNKRYNKADVNTAYCQLEVIEKYYSLNLNLNVLFLTLILQLARLSSRE